MGQQGAHKVKQRDAMLVANLSNQGYERHCSISPPGQCRASAGGRLLAERRYARQQLGCIQRLLQSQIAASCCVLKGPCTAVTPGGCCSHVEVDVGQVPTSKQGSKRQPC